MLNYCMGENMKVLGIIVEYNPFHNGHIYHIQKAKELTQCDYVIAVMSSSFVQRGEPAIIDKGTRSRLAIEHGVDLVIELPFVYACQSADYFAKGAIDLLHALGVTDICFGSEDGNINTFIEIATALKEHHDTYQQLIQKAMKQGKRYPDACNSALKTILHHEITTPNDLLGLSYVKEIMTHDYPITPHCFQRTNHYHDHTMQKIASASAIRQAIQQHQDYAYALPDSHLYQDTHYTLDDFFVYLKYQITMSSCQELQHYHMVEEGLENALKSHINHASHIEEFIQALLSKRYTRPRIQRMLIHILMKNTKEDIQKAMNIDYIRILAMNKQGRQYLKNIKKTCPYTIISRFSSYHHPALDIENKATQLLSLIDPSITPEYQYIPYIKEHD